MTVCMDRAVAMILAWRGSKIRGREQARLEEPRAGQEFLSAKRFLVFYGHYMAFPGISVASGHVPVAKYFSAIHHVIIIIIIIHEFHRDASLETKLQGR